MWSVLSLDKSVAFARAIEELAEKETLTVLGKGSRPSPHSVRLLLFLPQGPSFYSRKPLCNVGCPHSPILRGDLLLSVPTSPCFRGNPKVRAILN